MLINRAQHGIHLCTAQNSTEQHNSEPILPDRPGVQQYPDKMPPENENNGSENTKDTKNDPVNTKDTKNEPDVSKDTNKDSENTKDTNNETGPTVDTSQSNITATKPDMSKDTTKQQHNKSSTTIQRYPRIDAANCSNPCRRIDRAAAGLYVSPTGYDSYIGTHWQLYEE